MGPHLWARKTGPLLGQPPLPQMTPTGWFLGKPPSMRSMSFLDEWKLENDLELFTLLRGSSHLPSASASGEQITNE